MKLEKIKDNEHLLRDPVSGAVCNVEIDAIKTAVEMKKKRLQKLQEQDKLKEDVEFLKSEISGIKELMSKIVEKL